MTMILALAMASAAQATDAGAPLAPTAPIIRTLPSLPPPPPCARGCLNPIEAVTYADYLGERAGVAAEFQMPVRAVGARDGMVYLNSEKDYRDRNCLTVSIPAELAQRVFGSSDPTVLETKLTGQFLAVTGIAKKTRIDFTVHGRPTGKYYYQTQIVIGLTGQIRTILG